MPKMKSIRRFTIGALIISTLPLVLLIRHLLDLGNQYSAITYFQSSFKDTLSHAPSSNLSVVGVEDDDKVVVMAKLESENTDWVASELPSLVVTFSLSFQAVFPYANTHLPVLWLAARNLHRQSIHSFQRHTHHPSEQGPRGHGLLNLYNRQLRLPPFNNGIRAPPSRRLSVCLAHRCASAFQR